MASGPKKRKQVEMEGSASLAWRVRECECVWESSADDLMDGGTRRVVGLSWAFKVTLTRLDERQPWIPCVEAATSGQFRMGGYIAFALRLEMLCVDSNNRDGSLSTMTKKR